MAKKSVVETSVDKAVNEFVSIVKDTKNFVVKEAPQVLKEIITYYRVINFVWLFMGAAMIAGSLILLHNANCVPRIEFTNYDSLPGIANKALIMDVLGYISMIVGVIMTLANLNDFLKVCLAPKTFLLEYFRDFRRSNKD